MTRTRTRKSIDAHRLSGCPVPGEEIALCIDQALLQDYWAAWRCWSWRRCTIKSSIAAMKKWQAERPGPVTQRAMNHAGADGMGVAPDG